MPRTSIMFAAKNSHIGGLSDHRETLAEVQERLGLVGVAL